MLLTENMSNYIVGLTKRLDYSLEEFKKKYGFAPDSKAIPMRLAREIISDLQKIEDDLPF